MKKLVANAAIAAMFVLGSVWQAQAQGKVKIAIWDFENHSEQSWWFSNKLGPAARDQIDTEFSENPKLSAKFSVIERDKLDLVMKEQGLGASGALDPQTAAKVGRILGVRYILTGAIDKFDINNTKGGFGPIGGHLVQADATINIRLIDTTTAERIVSVAADGQVKKGGGFIKSANLSRDSEWGIASEAVQKTAKEVVAKFVDGGYLDKISSTIAPTAIEGKIIRVEGNKAYINLG
ncbi:MAG: CsgG/HfaB family protein, partial [Betaproteobacteria bacterium]